MCSSHICVKYANMPATSFKIFMNIIWFAIIYFMEVF